MRLPNLLVMTLAAVLPAVAVPASEVVDETLPKLLITGPTLESD